LVGIVVVVIAGILAVLGPVNLRGPSAGMALLTGWITYPLRVLPRVALNWDGLLGAMISLVALALGGHAFLRWFYRDLQVSRGSSATGEWPMRWTAMLLGLLLISFATVISAGLVFHQVGWLLSASQPLYEQYPSCAHIDFQLSQLEYGVLFGGPAHPLHPDWLACIVYLPVVDGEGKLREFIAYPRAPAHLQRLGVCIGRESGTYVRSPDELQQIIAEEAVPWTEPRGDVRKGLGGCGSAHGWVK
jgi:hypothetical protein